MCVCVCVCVIDPSQVIPDGDGAAEGETVITVGLDSVPVYLLTCVCPAERKTEESRDELAERDMKCP